MGFRDRNISVWFHKIGRSGCGQDSSGFPKANDKRIAAMVGDRFKAVEVSGYFFDSELSLPESAGMLLGGFATPLEEAPAASQKALRVRNRESRVTFFEGETWQIRTE